MFSISWLSTILKNQGIVSTNLQNLRAWFHELFYLEDYIIRNTAVGFDERGATNMCYSLLLYTIEERRNY